MEKFCHCNYSILRVSLNLISISTRVTRFTNYIFSGQEDFDKFRSLSYPMTDIYLLCFSIDSPTSFENAKNKWYKEISYYSPNVPMILVGTKCDLREDPKTIEQLAQQGQEPVSVADGQRLAKELDRCVKYMECSSKTQVGLKAVFNDAITYVLNSYSKPPPSARRCIIL